MESTSSSLRVEPLKAAHLTWLHANDQAALLPKLQMLLLRGWLAQAENLVPGLLISRQPFALVASEQHQLCSLLMIRPHNRQATCWRLELQALVPPIGHGQAHVNRELLKLALLGAHARSRSWVVRSSSGDLAQLGVLRELGFQPIRTMRRWRAPGQAQSQAQVRPALPKGLAWVEIDRQTTPLLWHLDQASTTSHQRQIVDRHPADLLDQAGPGTGVLIATRPDPTAGEANVAIAGLIRQQRCDDAHVFELLREPAWDQRIDQALPILLNQLRRQFAQATLVCSQEDVELGQRIDALGWQPLEDEFLLGRSLWRRQSAPRLLQGTRPLETMLGHLQPQQPPLPTPSLGRR